jgi:protein-L-isoaspartate(D-aspartate) O-methyltransferase
MFIKFQNTYPIMKKVMYLIAAAALTAFFLVVMMSEQPVEPVKPVREEVEHEREQERQEMVEKQIISRRITDIETVNAMLAVPRHLFVPEDLQNQAYADYPLPIGYGQTISQPYIVALMTASLELEGDEKALEIGTGSGYQAAILAEIVGYVYTVEIIPELAERSETTLKELEYTNVAVKNADGYFGWEEHSPYDVIMITAAVDHIPPPLIQQLKDGGKLILPLGNPLYYQTLTLVRKQEGEIYTKHISDVQFVPMTGYAQEKKVTIRTLNAKKRKGSQKENNITFRHDPKTDERLRFVLGTLTLSFLLYILFPLALK